MPDAASPTSMTISQVAPRTSAHSSWIAPFRSTVRGGEAIRCRPVPLPRGKITGNQSEVCHWSARELLLDAIEEVYKQIEHAQPGRAASPAPAPKGALSGRKKEEYNELVKKGFVLDPAGTRGDKDSGCRAETTLLESRSVRRPAGKIE